MGQRQDKDEIVYGNNCLVKFAPNETPKYLYARFSEIAQCPGEPIPPNDRTFKLTQHESFPCYWSIETDNLKVVFEFDSALEHSILSILKTVAPHGYLFWKTEVFIIDEGHVFHNVQDECVGTWLGTGGLGVITWKLQTLVIMAALGMATADDLFMEMRPLDDGNLVYKYCKLEDGTNIKVLYTPT